MELYYTDSKNVFSNYLNIIGTEVRNISKVKRHKTSDMIFVTDGTDNEYQTMITTIKKNCIEADIINKTRKVRETTTKVTLAQSIIKGNHMDFIIEKATELGVYEIIPIITARTIASVSDKKAQRYQKLMLTAMKTSTRTHLLHLTKPMIFDKLLDTFSEYDLTILAYEEEKNNRLTDVLTKKILNKVLLIIGPEGGFSSSEIKTASERGIKCFSLGIRRLRAETAAISALSLLLNEQKEM